MEHEMMQQLGLLESWQTELQELLAGLSTERQRHRPARKKLHFRLLNCMDVCQETNRVSYMMLPKSVIINIPIVASVVSDSPFDKENSSFEIEILTMSERGTIVVGAVNKEFKAGYQPGEVEPSVGYNVADGSCRFNVWKSGAEVRYDKSAICSVGDKVGCGVDLLDDGRWNVYFTKNGNRVFECLLDGDGCEPPLYPAISMASLKEEIRLLQEVPWRSSKPGSENKEKLKLCRETGQLSFRSTKDGGRDLTILANLPFSKQFAYFEIEIRALGPEDEISIGGVPEDYSLRKLPGTRPRSLGFHGRVGGIFPGVDVKRDDAPKCVVGDKMGCGIEHRANGKRHLYFTHNSKSFMEAELNENCPSNLYPAIGMHSHGSTVCICLLDCSRWGSAEDDAGTKPVQVDMTTEVDSEPGTVLVDRETARASYTAPVGVTKDAVLVSSNQLSVGNQPYFEIEILYGNVITIGLVPKGHPMLTVHPGWTETSIGYNADSGYVYTNGQMVKTRQMKSTYGDRVGCGIKQNDSQEDKLVVYFNKNGATIFEVPFGDRTTEYSPAIGMRSASQVLAVRLLDKPLWSCDTVEPVKNDAGPGLTQEILDRELIECPICRDIFKDPRILPCSVHTFCSDCLKQYIDQHHGKRSIPCPVCQKLFIVPSGGVSELPCNPLVARLLEIRSKMTGN